MPLASSEASGIAVSASQPCGTDRYQNMKKKASTESLAAENAALQEEVAALRVRLARPAAGRQPRNGTPLTAKQRNDLRAATKRIARAWTGLDSPGEAWLSAQLDSLPSELRALRPEADWRKLVLGWIERRQAKMLIV